MSASADARSAEVDSPHSNAVAFVQSGWHRDIVDRCRDSFTATMAELAPDTTVEYFELPGALELPLMAQRLAGTGRYRAIVLSGLVVDGGIYRHEFVASAVLDGLMRVQLDAGVPVLSAVLTPHHFHEHEAHRAFFYDHFVVKGEEVARACVATIEAHAAIPGDSGVS